VLAAIRHRHLSETPGYAGELCDGEHDGRGRPYEGSSLFAKLVNLWLLTQPPAVATGNASIMSSGK